jgi:drug/metabolite transporter (DMT)-like permease
MQLGLAAVLLLPYTLITGEFSLSMDVPSAVMMILVGVIHTGFAYWLYFGSISGLRAQTVALLSYIDPVVAVIASWAFLGEPLTVPVIIGAVLIIGSAFLSERTNNE